MFVESGFTGEKFFAKVRFDGIQNTETPPDIAGFTVQTPFPGGVLNQVIVGDQDVFKFTAQVNYDVWGNWAVTGEVLHVPAGKNTVYGTTYILGLIAER